MSENDCKNHVSQRLEGVWRETCLAFLEYLNVLKVQPFHIINYESYSILYIDKLDCYSVMDEYLQSFINIFRIISGIENKQYCLVFLPETDDQTIQRSIINKVVQVLQNRDILLLYRKNSYQELIDNEFDTYENYKVTYNSRLDIKEFHVFDDYLNNLASKKRRFLKKSMLIFEKNSDMKARKFEISKEKERVLQLYKECCVLHEDTIECDFFLDNLEFALQVEWYGIFAKSELVMFSGYWKNENSVIFGMFGKDYDKEQLLRDSHAYFVLNLKMIESAILAGYDRIYNGFGEGEMKKSMGYMIDDYFLMVGKAGVIQNSNEKEW